MAQSVTKLWENISVLLADAANQPNDLAIQSAQAIELTLLASPVSTTASLLDAPTMKKLVQAKVPLQVWQSCSRLAQAARPIKTAIASSAACRLFKLLIGRDSSGATLSSKASSTQRGLLQQLQQSSLLQQLPLMLTVTAHKAQAAAAAAAAAGDDAELAAFHASQGSSSPPAPGWTPIGDPAVLAKALLYIFANTCVLQTHIYVSTAEGVACVLPAMHLIVATKQYLTTCSNVRQHHEVDPSLHELSTLVVEASLCCDLVVRQIDSPHSTPVTSQSLQQQLLGSVHFQEWLCLRLTNIILMRVTEQKLAHQAQQQPAQQQQPPGSKPLSRAQYSAAVYAAVDEVPEPLCQLLQQLGVSREVAVLTSACTRHEEGGPEVRSPATAEGQRHLLLESYLQLLQHHIKVMGGQLEGGQEQQQQRQQRQQHRQRRQQQEHELQQQQRVLQLRWLLSIALLQQDIDAPWEDTPPISMQQFRRLWFCQQACNSAHLACAETMFCGFRGQAAQEQQRLGQGIFQEQCRSYARQLLPADTAHTLRQYTMCLLPQITRARRLQWEAADAAASAAITPTSAGSSSSSPAPQPIDEEEAYNTLLEVAISSAGQLANWLGWHAMPGAAAAAAAAAAAVQPSPGSAAAGPAAAAAATAAGELCSMLQDLARVEIQASRRNIIRNSTQLREVQLAPGLRRKVTDESVTLGQLLSTLVAQDLTRAVLTGPSSTASLQLFGLICALLKAYNPWAAAGAAGADPGLAEFGSGCLHVAGDTADYMFAIAVLAGAGQAGQGFLSLLSDTAVLSAPTVPAGAGNMAGSMCSTPAAGGTAGSSAEQLPGSAPADTAGAGVPAASSASAAGGDSASENAGSTCYTAAAGSIEIVLPWVALRGRCCLHAAALAASMSGGERLVDRAGLLLRAAKQLTMVRDWLLGEDVAQQLSRLGYEVDSVVQVLQVVDTTVVESAFPGSGPWDSAAVSQALEALAQQLQAAGHALSSFATPHCCNNPWCSNVLGPSEAVLVGGRGCMCGGCRTARYCSKVCQKQHWKAHKPVCKALAAATAAAAAAGVGGA